MSSALVKRSLEEPSDGENDFLKGLMQITTSGVGQKFYKDFNSSFRKFGNLLSSFFYRRDFSQLEYLALFWQKLVSFSNQESYRDFLLLNVLKKLGYIIQIVTTTKEFSQFYVLLSDEERNYFYKKLQCADYFCYLLKEKSSNGRIIYKITS